MPVAEGQRTVAVLHQGQPDATHPVIVNAWALQRDLCDALESLGHRAAPVFLDAESTWVARLLELSPDVVFHAADLGFDYDITLEPYIAAVIEGTGLRYTGTPAYASAFSSDKHAAKLYLARLGVAVPKSWLLSELDAPDLCFPVILKARFGHNSFGLTTDSVLYDRAALDRRVEALGDAAPQFLLEEFIEGEEVAAAFLGNAPRRTMPQFKIRFGSKFDGLPKILDYDAKWTAASDTYQGSTVVPTEFPASLTAVIDRALLRAADFLMLRDYARCDFRVRTGADGVAVPYIIDVNANPDLSRDAGFFRMAAAAGYTYSQLVGAIVEAALARPARGRQGLPR
jgi:D-alanine-D-alanine ligase